MRELHLLTAKPVMYVANVDETASRTIRTSMLSTSMQREKARRSLRSARRSRPRLPYSMTTTRAEFLDDLGFDEPGLNRVIRGGYSLLGLQTFFTAGPKEVRAWTTKVGATAPQAAGEIHTDFEKGFIRAEVIGYDDYVTGNGEQGAKEAGRLRLEGKEYIVTEGDVMHFRFNV